MAGLLVCDAALVDNYISPFSSLSSPGIDELRWILPVRPGDKLMVRATIIETKRSRSKPDRGIVRTFIETINQYEDLVMSFRSVNFMLCRESSSSDNTNGVIELPPPIFYSTTSKS
jgi:acyl dehydratase